MPMKPPASVGMSLAEVDTPALLIDLDAFEANLKRMADFARKAGVRLRPHAKTHKSPDIAKRQIALGAVGVCCQKVSEAETMVDAGIGDVLVTNEVAGAAKLARLAALAKRATVGVCVDDIASVDELEAAADEAGSMLDVLVEIDVGGRRCGVAPGAGGGAHRRAHRRRAASVLRRPAGLSTARPSTCGRPPSGASASPMRWRACRRPSRPCAPRGWRRASSPEAAPAPTSTRPPAASTPSCSPARTSSWTPTMPATCARTAARSTPIQHALFVQATVMSAPAPERRIVDAGLKTLCRRQRHADALEARRRRLSAAVGRARQPGCLRPCRGRRRAATTVLLVPGHCDPTVNLHDWYVGVRGMAGNDPRVECVWPVAARGALF